MAERGAKDTLPEDEDEGIVGALKRYGEKSLEGLGRGARKLRKKISLIDKLSDPTNAGDAAIGAAKFAAESTMPGSGFVTGAEGSRRGWEDIKKGNYLRGGIQQAAGGIDMAFDLLPMTPSVSPLVAMFLGVGAKNAPLDKLDDAYDRLKGERRDLFEGTEHTYSTDEADVFRDTGWFVNKVDGKPRWEIDDSNVKVHEQAYNRSQSSLGLGRRDGDMLDPPAKVGDLIDHPELYENYPHLAKVPLRAEYGNKSGSFQKGGPWMGQDLPQKMTLKADSRDAMVNVALHELQHGVQYDEGFGTGGSAGMFNLREKESAQYLAELDQALKAAHHAQELGIDPKKFLEVTEESSEAAAKLIEAMDGDASAVANWLKMGGASKEEILQRANLIDQIRANGPKTSYHKVSGEVESRNVMNRHHLSEKERKGLLDDPGLKLTEHYIGMNSPMLDKPMTTQTTMPWNTQDVPYDAQILRMQGHLPARLIDGIPYKSTDVLSDGLPMMSEPPDDIPGMGHNGGPRMEQPKRKMNVKGDYVGAPEGVNTPAKETELIDRVEDLIKRAPAGAEKFYDDFSGQIKDHVRDSMHARQYGAAIGATSPLSTVDKNISKANTAMNQYTLDGQVDLDGYGIGTKAQGERVQQHLDEGSMPKGPKTGPFAHNVISTDYPQPDDPQQGVMDTWMGRGMGYQMLDKEKSGGLKKSNIDYMNNHIMPGAYERTGTDYKTGQAAAWETLRQDAGEPPQEPIETLFQRNRSTTQMAAIPGPSTGAKPELLNAPLDRKREYTDKMFDAIGDNKIAQSLGLSGPTEEGFGPWQGMMEPNRTIGLQTGTKGSVSEGNMQIDPASDKLGETMRHWYMLVLGQDASGLTTARPVKTPSAADVIAITHGRPVNNPSSYNDVFKFLEREYGAKWPDNIVVQPAAGGGFQFKDIGAGNAALQRMAERYAQEVGGTLQYGKGVGEQFDWIDWSKGEWRSLLKGTLENPRLRAKADQVLPEIAERAQKVHSNFAKQMGFKTDTQLDKMRSILAKDGIDGVLAAAKKGVIPALAPLLVLSIVDEMGLLDDEPVSEL